MIKVIETNLSMGHLDLLEDHQSRVIEVESWEDYVEEIRNGISIPRMGIYGSMYGLSVPRTCTIKNFKSDDKHLTCDIVLFNNTIMTKLAYRI